MASAFPDNPSDGMIFELQSGLFFRFDAVINSWIRLTVNSLSINKATAVSDGLMAGVDLAKLNRLLLSPPVSTIVGNDCIAPFRSGQISLFGDDLVSVDGVVSLRNVGSLGEDVSFSEPFKISQNVYGFDFGVNVDALVAELGSRGQYNVVGKRGPVGDAGEVGDPGVNVVISGPPGADGDSGSALPCSLVVESDTLPSVVRPGLNKALVGLSVVKDEFDPSVFKLVFDRQAIGSVGFAASELVVDRDSSSWVLAVDVGQAGEVVDDSFNCSEVIDSPDQYQLYYVDLEPIISAIHAEYVREANILKRGYEDITAYWIGVMSDLFDEQKAALCCALQFCLSATKSTSIRQHIESVAASAAGSANVLLHGRNSNEAVEVSSTKLLREIGGPDLCNNGVPFPQRSPDEADASPLTVERRLFVDPSVNFNSMTASVVDLDPGVYLVSIVDTSAFVDGLHRANCKLQYNKDGVSRVTQFIDKGSYKSVIEASSVYADLSFSFTHSGGMVLCWLPSENPTVSSGSVSLQFRFVKPLVSDSVVDTVKAKVLDGAVERVCSMDASHLAWYNRGWRSRIGCGIVVNVFNQNFLIVKRSIGISSECGGGENVDRSCIKDLISDIGHPAVAWPTFDKLGWAPIPDAGNIEFIYNSDWSAEVSTKIAAGDFVNLTSYSTRELLDIFSVAIFPGSGI